MNYTLLWEFEWKSRKRATLGHWLLDFPFFTLFFTKKLFICLEYQVKIHLFALYEYLQKVQKHFSSKFASYGSLKWNSVDYQREIGYTFSEKNGSFSSQLGIIKCSEITHFSMKFSSEGEFCHCHFAGIKLGASHQMFQAK